MCHLRRSTANIQRRARELFNAECLKAYARTDYVHDRVHRANFMEVDLLERHRVHSGLGFAEAPKYRGRIASNRLAQLRLTQDLKDRQQATVLALILGRYTNDSGGHAVFPDLVGGDGPAW